MKTKNNLLIIATLLGTLLFSYLFWRERLGLNLLVYSLFIVAVTTLNKEVIKSTKFTIYGLVHLAVAITATLINSDLSIIAYYITLILFVGYSHSPKIRLIFTAVISFIVQFACGIFNFINQLNWIDFSKINTKPYLKLFKYLVLPIGIVGIFIIIYCAANDIFAHYVSAFFNSIASFFSSIIDFVFKDISIERVLHLILGFILSAGLLIGSKFKKIENAEIEYKENLIRTKKKSKIKTVLDELIEIFTGPLSKRFNALKTENIIAIISFSALNILLLIINLIDITMLWFGFKPVGNFANDLHQGTNALIFSIFLAMLVILYFFRGNLNFYSKSKTIKLLAYCWMAQNFILIVSVFIRDGFYIDHFGLTYKRIGVLVFALLCIFGLLTVYIKVAKQKTLFYLFKTNGNIWMALLVVFSFVNWDVLIAKYNLANKDNIEFDPHYLLSLSNRALTVLDENRDKLITNPNNIEKSDYLTACLNNRIELFKKYNRAVDWQAWNLSDYKNAKHFGLK